jgi:hypothetical protein
MVEGFIYAIPAKGLCRVSGGVEGASIYNPRGAKDEGCLELVLGICTGWFPHSLG